MEKIAKIPEGVNVEVKGLHIAVKGKNGELSRDFDDPRYNGLLKIEKKDSSVHVYSMKDNRTTNAVVGTIAAHVRNMIRGASSGFKYEMKIMYTHFPITISVSGNDVSIKNFFGEKGARSAKVIGATKVVVDKEIITLTGASIEDVGQTAANIEQACKLTGRDRRIFQDGAFITKKHLSGGKSLIW